MRRILAHRKAYDWGRPRLTTQSENKKNNKTSNSRLVRRQQGGMKQTLDNTQQTGYRERTTDERQGRGSDDRQQTENRQQTSADHQGMSLRPAERRDVPEACSAALSATAVCL
jgi:hypothetical protein